MAYMLPQVVINQLFSEVPLNVIQDQNVFVFGPNYQVMSCSDPDRKDSLFLGHYNGSGIEVGGVVNAKDSNAQIAMDYPGLPDGTEIDTGSVRLVGDNVRIKLAEVDGFTKLDDEVTGDDVDGRIMFDDAIAGDARDPEIFKRSIRAGDVFTIADKDFSSVILEVFESVKGSGKYDCVRISDALPDDLAHDDSNGYSCAAEFDTDLDGWEIPREGSPIEGNYQWNAGDEKFVVTGDNGDSLTVEYPEWDNARHAVISADLYVEYRTLLLGASDTIHSITNNDDVYTVLGDVVPENPLAYGVNKTLQNSADRVVYYMATRGDTVEAYSRVLDMATKTDKVYILVPLTNEAEVLDEVQKHVDSMSTGRNKLWRISFINHEVPLFNTLYTMASYTDGKGVKATFESPVDGKVVVKFEDGKTKCMSQVVVGDDLVVYDETHTDAYTGDIVPSRYRIDRVLNNSCVRIAVPSGSDAPNGIHRVEVEHEYTEQEQATAIASASRKYMDRRMYNVFPTWYSTEDGTAVSGVFLACACAGVVSSVLPQQPVTNMEVRGIAGVPVCYEMFSREQLNEIAEGGTFIVMQDLPGDRVYIRHQLSTEYGSNNLLKSELSITKNLDSISYYLSGVFRPLIGRYNITPKLLLIIRNMLEDAISVLERDTSVGTLGPQVLADGTGIRALYQDPVNKDHVRAELTLNMPRPFNVLDLNLEVI